MSRSSEVRAVGNFRILIMRGTPINRSIWTCRRSNDLWQDAMKWWTFGDMKNGMGIYECHGQLERFRNGSSRAFTPQSQPDQFRSRSTAITSRGGRLVPERPDAVEQVWTRAPGCVPEPFRSQSCGMNTVNREHGLSPVVCHSWSLNPCRYFVGVLSVMWGWCQQAKCVLKNSFYY